MSSLTLFVLVAIAIWSYRPLRMFLIQRTNRTVKVLLVVFPLLFLGRVGYNLYSGQQDDLLASILLVGGLLFTWGALVWLGNALEKRKPTKVQAPDLAVLSRLPGMPRVPGFSGAAAVANNPEVQRLAAAAVNSPQVQRAARAGVQAVARTAAQVDTSDVAGSLGRISGRWAAKIKRSVASDQR